MVSDTTTRLIVYKTNNVWILSRNKVASSWLYAEFQKAEFELEWSNFQIRFLASEGNDHIFNDFSKDWDLVKNGLTPSREIMFLIKNPIHKFITGWIQDFIMIIQGDNDHLNYQKERLTKQFGEELTTELFEFSKEIDKELTSGKKFPDIPYLPKKLYEIYHELMFPKNYDFFNRDIRLVQDDMTTGHSEQSLYFLYDLIKNQNNFNTEKIQIIDIDLFDLKLILEKKYNLNLSNDNDSSNKRGNYLRFKTHEYLKPYGEFISHIYSLELFFWLEIIKEIYDKVDDIYKKPLSQYKKKYFIPNDSDFFNFSTHILWHIDDLPDYNNQLELID